MRPNALVKPLRLVVARRERDDNPRAPGFALLPQLPLKRENGGDVLSGEFLDLVHRAFSLKDRAHPCDQGAGGDVENEMPDMIFPVVSELVRACDALELRVKMGEEVGMGEQHPVQKADIVDVHEIEHHEKADEELPEAETVFHAVPRGEDRRSEKERQSERNDDPADNVRAGETLLFVGDHGDILLRRGGEKALVLNNPTAPYRRRKYAEKIISVARIVIFVFPDSLDFAMAPLCKGSYQRS